MYTRTQINHLRKSVSLHLYAWGQSQFWIHGLYTRELPQSWTSAVFPLHKTNLLQNEGCL